MAEHEISFAYTIAVAIYILYQYKHLNCTHKFSFIKVVVLVDFMCFTHCYMMILVLVFNSHPIRLFRLQMFSIVSLSHSIDFRMDKQTEFIMKLNFFTSAIWLKHLFWNTNFKEIWTLFSYNFFIKILVISKFLLIKLYKYLFYCFHSQLKKK